MKLKDLEKWLNPTDLAQKAGVRRQSVHGWLENGLIRAVKTRAGWIIDPEDAERFVKERAERKSNR